MHKYLNIMCNRSVVIVIVMCLLVIGTHMDHELKNCCVAKFLTYELVCIKIFKTRQRAQILAARHLDSVWTTHHSGSKYFRLSDLLHFKNYAFFFLTKVFFPKLCVKHRFGRNIYLKIVFMRKHI